jgi:hypothetical protein
LWASHGLKKLRTQQGYAPKIVKNGSTAATRVNALMALQQSAPTLIVCLMGEHVAQMNHPLLKSARKIIIVLPDFFAVTATY